METHLAPEFAGTAEGQEAAAILRTCVHCGFCTATCPTYQLLGDELDGPRGRIYLLKQVFEGQAPSRITQLHLDRCLTCRSCETTCPSGVQYGRLADLGRAVIEEQVGRPLRQRILRRLLRAVVPYPRRFGVLLKVARLFAPVLPAPLRRKVPPRRSAGAWPQPGGTRQMLVLEGCAQSAATPLTNAAAARVLARLGIDLIRARGAGCCGALSTAHCCATTRSTPTRRRGFPHSHAICRRSSQPPTSRRWATPARAGASPSRPPAPCSMPSAWGAWWNPS
jgi:glycolate oxidase iron-sulfur subunit